MAVRGRAELDARAPEAPEPFDAIFDDFNRLIVPGLTHWNHPGFFAYFANTGSEPGILAELLAAGLNQVGILWRTSPALQELEELTLDWLRQLLGLPEGLHGHIEDSASTEVARQAAIDPLGLGAQEAQIMDVRRVEGADQQNAVVEALSRLMQHECRLFQPPAL